ncbi:hypothetical protein K438DRAFT_915209 [Mycena galopus ATCC 62051]|nr:hypothetical protein K438DRAFT_915209 [Mycena galopus ATCC 62051]
MKSDIIRKRSRHDARRGGASASVSETPTASPGVSRRASPAPNGPASSASTSAGRASPTLAPDSTTTTHTYDTPSELSSALGPKPSYGHPYPYHEQNLDALPFASVDVGSELQTAGITLRFLLETLVGQISLFSPTLLPESLRSGLLDISVTSQHHEAISPHLIRLLNDVFPSASVYHSVLTELQTSLSHVRDRNPAEIFSEPAVLAHWDTCVSLVESRLPILDAYNAVHQWPGDDTITSSAPKLAFTGNQ